MSQIITTAGRNLLAEKTAKRETLVLDTFVFAYHDNQQHEDAISAERTYPDESAIRAVHSVTRTGYVRDDTVAYSVFIDAHADEFVFNTVYLIHNATKTVFAIETTPTTTKTKTDISSNLRGSNLSRSFVVSFNAARAITHIDMPAEAWMFDFERATTQSAGMMFEAPDDENVWGRYKGEWVKVWQTGDVKMFSGTREQIERGWTLADGTGTLSDGRRVPDLRGRFIFGANDFDEIDKSGGRNGWVATTEEGAHTHKITTEGTSLTLEQMPKHHHIQPFAAGITSCNAYGNSSINSHCIENFNAGYWHRPYTSSAGGDYNLEEGKSRPHYHKSYAHSTGEHKHHVYVKPRYYTLAFIIKL